MNLKRAFLISCVLAIVFIGFQWFVMIPFVAQFKRLPVYPSFGPIQLNNTNSKIVLVSSFLDCRGKGPTNLTNTSPVLRIMLIGQCRLMRLHESICLTLVDSSRRQTFDKAMKIFCLPDLDESSKQFEGVWLEQYLDREVWGELCNRNRHCLLYTSPSPRD